MYFTCLGLKWNPEEIIPRDSPFTCPAESRQYLVIFFLSNY